MKSRAEGENDDLIRELNQLKKDYDELRRHCREQSAHYERTCSLQSRTEEALQLAKVIIDRSPVILFRRLAGDKPKLVYVSDNIKQIGYRAADFLDGTMQFKDIVHPEDFERLRSEVSQYADQDLEEYTQVYRILDSSGEVHWVEDQTSVVRDDAGNKKYHQGILIDFTRRKHAEEQLRKSEEKYRRIVETAGEGFILMDENLVIIDVNDAYCRMLGYERQEILGRTPLDFASDDFRQFIQGNREKLLAMEYRTFEGTVIARDGHEVPILVHGNTLRNDQGDVIGNMAFVTDLTEQKKALALAGEVQKSLLPHTQPKVSGFDVAGRNISSDEIGGDYFDFFWRSETPDAPFSIVVGDITGHGVDAALLMTSARAFLRMRASQPGTLTEIVSEMNRHLARDVLEMGRFMTLFFMIVEPQNHRLHWVRAGHDPAFLYDPIQDRFEELKGEGLALGVDPDFTYRQYRKEGLSTDQVITIGTDGIWEAFNQEGEMFGKERFRAVVRASARGSASQILDAVYGEIHQFTKGKKTADDITLVVIKVDGDK